MKHPEAFRHFLNLIAPVSCSGCQRPDIRLCDRCKKILPGRTLMATPVVARALYKVPIFSAGLYRGVRRSLVLAVKDGAKRTLVPYLLHPALLTSLAEVIAKNPGAVLVPVPGSPLGTLRRGYWPTQLIAREIQRKLPSRRVVGVVRALRFRGVRVLAPSRRVHTPRSGGQSSGRAHRLSRNSQDFFVVSLKSPSKVILVDDVMTTGGTLEAGAKALHARGHLVVAVVVVAHVPTAVREPIPLLRQRDYAGGHHPHAKNVS